MRILLVSPQPFFQERGTPIAVDLLLKALSEQEHQIDLLVFNEGEDRYYPNLTIHRTRSFPTLNGIKPGFSIKKVYLDCWLFIKMIRLCWQHQYDVVHAVEESAFFAILLRPFFKFNVVFDMDSSMSTQLIDKYPILKKIEPVFRYIESRPMKYADAVVPMCDALADEVLKLRQDGVTVLRDIDLSNKQQVDEFIVENPELKDEHVKTLFDHPEFPLFMYIGNLESYQGIRLLIDSLALLLNKGGKANVAIIGGEDSDITFYQKYSDELGVSNNLLFLGKRPVKGLGFYLSQADILVSPRTQGVNTPMKIYSYLGSNKPVLATNLPTHTQVMSKQTAILANPQVDDFGLAMYEIAKQPSEYHGRAEAAANLIEQEHSYDAFSNTLRSVYAKLNASHDK